PRHRPPPAAAAAADVPADHVQAPPVPGGPPRAARAGLPPPARRPHDRPRVRVGAVGVEAADGGLIGAHPRPRARHPHAPVGAGGRLEVVQCQGGGAAVGPRPGAVIVDGDGRDGAAAEEAKEADAAGGKGRILPPGGGGGGADGRPPGRRRGGGGVQGHDGRPGGDGGGGSGGGSGCRGRRGAATAHGGGVTARGAGVRASRRRRLRRNTSGQGARSIRAGANVLAGAETVC
ncbi:hypothetical protein BU14_2709s0001, partial [Porphyra umbilicalis]